MLLQITLLDCSVPKKHQQTVIIQRKHIFYSCSKSLCNFFRKLLFVNGNQIVVILGTPSHRQHQKLVLIILFYLIIAQNLSDVLPVCRNDSLLNPDFTPIRVYCSFILFYKGIQQQRQFPRIRTFRQFNIKPLFKLIIKKIC